MSTHRPPVPGWAPAPAAFSSSLAWPDEPPPTWRQDAACRHFPTELFFPIGHGPRAQAQASQAKLVCNECPVRVECLDYALTTNAQFGVFGGMSEDERRRVRRSLSRQVRVTSASMEETA